MKIKSPLFVAVLMIACSPAEQEKTDLKQYYFSNKDFVWQLRKDCERASRLIKNKPFEITWAGVDTVIVISPAIETSEYQAFVYSKSGGLLNHTHSNSMDSLLAIECESIHEAMRDPLFFSIVKRVHQASIMSIKNDNSRLWFTFLDHGVNSSHYDIYSGILLNEDEAYYGRRGFVEKIDSGVFLFDATP